MGAFGRADRSLTAVPPAVHAVPFTAMGSGWDTGAAWSRPVVRGIATVLALAAAAACSGGAATAPDAPQVGTPDAPQVSTPDAPPIAAGSRYVAMGSSFAAGPGIEPVADAGCRRSAVNYPSLVAAHLDLDLLDVSCAGATTYSVLADPQDAGTPRPPQLESLDADTALVTVTVGGNDVGYADALEQSRCDLAGTGCVEPARAEIETDLELVTGRLTLMLEQIGDAAPNALVLLVTYPRILPADGVTCPQVPVAADTAAYLRDVGDRLDGAFRAAADAAGTGVVDLFTDSSVHGACEASDPWVGGVPGAAAPGAVAFHPTETGMQAAADRLLAALG